MIGAGLAARGSLAQQELLGTAWRLRRRLAIAVAGIVGAGLLTAILVQPNWESQSSLLVLLGEEYGYRGPAGDSSVVNAAFDHDEILGTEVGVLSSPDVQRATLRQVGLASVYPDIADPGVVRRAIARLRAAPKALLEAIAGAKPPAPVDPVDLALDSFAKDMTIAAEKQGAVIDLAFRNPDPAIARTVLQTFEQIYLQRRAELFADHDAAFVAGQVDAARTALEASDQRLAAFKRDHRIADYAGRVDLLQAQQSELEKDAMDAQNAVEQLHARQVSLRTALAAMPSQLPFGQDTDVDQRLATLRAALDAARGRQAELRASYQAGSTPLTALDAQVATLSAALEAARSDRRAGAYHTSQNPTFIALGQQSSQADIDLAAASARGAQDRRQLAAVQAQLQSLGAAQSELEQLERQRQVLGDNYAAVTRLRSERNVVEQVEARRQGDVRVISAPTLPPRASGLRLILLAASIVLAGIVAGTMVLLTHFLRQTFLLPASLERDGGIAVLAVLPRIGSLPAPAGQARRGVAA